MSDMFWIALELSIPKIGLNILLSLTVKKLHAFKFDGVSESDNTAKTAWPKLSTVVTMTINCCPLATRLLSMVRSLRFAGDSQAA